MDSLNSRKTFIDRETASLFSNEKVTTARNKIIECLNNIALSENQQTKCEDISKIQELLLYQEIDLLDEFIDDILTLAHDTFAEVRKSIAGFVEKLSQKDISYLPKTISILVTLLRDSSPQVVKRVIQGCCSIYKNTLKYLCDSTTEITDDLEQTWTKLCLIKTRILDMIDFENDGIRTNAIKFLEGVVVLQTSNENESQEIKRTGDFTLQSIPNNLKILKRRKLEDEAMNIFDLLLKFHGASHISSVNLIACTGTLCNIAKVRPALLPPVIEALKNLHNNLPPTLTNSQVSTVRKHLKMQFLNILKQSFGLEHTVQSELLVILKDLGCNDADLKKQLHFKLKRSLAIDDMPNKRQRISKPTTCTIEDNEDAVSQTNLISEKILHEKLLSVDMVIDLVIAGMDGLPQEIPSNFLVDYTPIGDSSIQDQINRISELLAKQIKLGPESAFLSEKVPNNIENKDDSGVTARHLKESLERMKGHKEQIVKSKRIKLASKKLNEITKPLSKENKENLLNQTILRILKYNPDTKNVGVKKNKILAVIGSTFVPNVKKLILNFVLEDFKSRTPLALQWLYNEYCLVSDFNYNQLLLEIISAISTENDNQLKVIYLRKLYLEAPLITDDALHSLEKMCEIEEVLESCLDILVDLITQTPTKRFLNLLFTLSISRTNATRTLAVTKIINIYKTVDMFKNDIEKYSIDQMNLVIKNKPPEKLGDVWTENEAKICFALILELLPYKHKLIHSLGDVYIQVNADLKRTILRAIEKPIKIIGPGSEELNRLIETCKKGTETLVIRVVYLLTEQGPLKEDLINKIRNLYKNNIVTDIRILIPIINSLTKQEVLRILPLILKLNPVVIKEVFGLNAVELLVALHTVDLSQIDLKFIVKAASLCLSESEYYSHEVLAVVLKQLSEISPLPTLFMRTVIQSLSLHPRLSGFIINMLQRLVLKQIWKQQKVVWDGFVKCCQRLLPASLGVLIQLPATQLNDALLLCPELRAPLLEYAQSITENQIGNVSDQVMSILKGKADDIKQISLETSNEKLQNEPDPPGLEL
uniref:CSON005637 protein n=1 Tax=Culicoides sonorensis TaxID=179676 RepID=A0A336LMS5_CULSO